MPIPGLLNISIIFTYFAYLVYVSWDSHLPRVLFVSVTRDSRETFIYVTHWSRPDVFRITRTVWQMFALPAIQICKLQHWKKKSKMRQPHYLTTIISPLSPPPPLIQSPSPTIKLYKAGTTTFSKLTFKCQPFSIVFDVLDTILPGVIARFSAFTLI